MPDGFLQDFHVGRKQMLGTCCHDAQFTTADNAIWEVQNQNLLYLIQREESLYWAPQEQEAKGFFVQLWVECL